MSIKQTIKDTMLTSGAPLHFASNEPPQYAGKQYEYYAPETLWFINDYAKYSSDYVEAQVQGLDVTKPFDYTTVHIRFADVVNPSAAITAQMDNYKNILIAEKEYTYIRKGAKVIALGSTWLVINPENLSGGDGMALVQKCDALWHYYDFYGNVCTEPMAIGKDALRANDPDAQRSVMVGKGYFVCKMQYNEVTKTLLDNNSRMILGRGAYHLSGFMDFIQEFTSVEESVNLLEFTMRWEAPIQPLDDEINKVANGKTFKWEILLDGKNTLRAGSTAQIAATSMRTNENSTSAVEGTDEYPVSYTWVSGDDSVCTVDENGVVTAIAEGTTTITATLEQNPNISSSWTMTVEGTSAEPHIEFNSQIPPSLRIYNELIVAATYYENGAETDQQLTWELSGADPSTYSYIVEKVYETLDGAYTTDPDNHKYTVAAARNGIVIKCWGGSVTDLIIKASYGDVSAETSIALVGL